jgi:DNA-binding CsgD family transcriptional regulator
MPQFGRRSSGIEARRVRGGVVLKTASPRSTPTGADVFDPFIGDRLGLTPRELEILTWIARGQTNSEIAETLWIAPSTVRTHLENIYAKLGVHTRTAAVARLLGVKGVGTDRPRPYRSRIGRQQP